MRLPTQIFCKPSFIQEIYLYQYKLLSGHFLLSDNQSFFGSMLLVDLMVI